MKGIVALAVILLGGVFIAGADSWPMWLLWAIATAAVLGLSVESLADRWRK